MVDELIQGYYLSISHRIIQMKSLSQQIQKISNDLVEENRRILQMLTSIQNRSGMSSPKYQKEGKIFVDRRSKTPSIVTRTSKKLGESKERNILNSSIKTIKRLKSCESSAPMARCSSCKLLKKQSQKSIRLQSDSRKQKPRLGKETNLMRMKKLSQKIIPRVSSKLIYAKKTQVTHFQHQFF